MAKFYESGDLTFVSRRLIPGTAYSGKVPLTVEIETVKTSNADIGAGVPVARFEKEGKQEMQNQIGEVWASICEIYEFSEN